MSDKQNLNERIEKLIQLAEEVGGLMNVGVLETKFGQQGKNRTVEVTIYRKPGGISLSDCEAFSRELDARLEALATTPDAIVDGAYMLEVQSPGLDRVLKNDREYDIFAGEKVQVQSKEKIEGLGHTFVATLAGTEGGSVKFEKASKPVDPKTKGKAKIQETIDVVMPKEQVSTIKLIVDLSQQKEEVDAELESNLN